MAELLSYIGQDDSEGQVVSDVFPNDDDYYLAEASPFRKDDAAATSLKESSTGYATGYNAVILDLSVASGGNSTNSKGQSSQQTQAPANLAYNNTSYPTQQSYYGHYNYNQPDIPENQAIETTGSSSISQTGTSTVQESKSTESNSQSKVSTQITSTREDVQQSTEQS